MLHACASRGESAAGVAARLQPLGIQARDFAGRGDMPRDGAAAPLAASVLPRGLRGRSKASMREVADEFRLRTEVGGSASCTNSPAGSGMARGLLTRPFPPVGRWCWPGTAHTIRRCTLHYPTHVYREPKKGGAIHAHRGGDAGKTRANVRRRRTVGSRAREEGRAVRRDRARARRPGIWRSRRIDAPNNPHNASNIAPSAVSI